MKLKSSPALEQSTPPLYRCTAVIAGSALVLSLFAQPALEAQQGPQYPQSQYVQPTPNYIANSQYKPTPYKYPQAPPQSVPDQTQQAQAPQYQSEPNQSQPYQSNQYAQQQPYPQQQPYNQQPPPSYQQQQNPQQYQDPQYDPDQADVNQGYQNPAGPQQGGVDPQQFGSQQTAQPFAADQLTQLVAPIALYPDNLVAQILAASTYPAQVIAADNWLRSLGRVSADQVAAGASAQTSWDPSVKALTAFPQVLAMMDHDLQWTTDLGNAYYNQPQDVMQTIQVMRQRAQSAGNLQNTPQQQVSDNQGYIQLAPTNPQVVYVPSYNPWLAYGAPINAYPGFSFLDAVGAVIGTGLRFGLGIGIGAFMNTPFGWAGWGLNWLASAIFFHHSPYYSHSESVAHWGGGRGGWNRGGGNFNARNGGINREPRGFDRGQQGFQHFGNNNGFGERGFNRVPDRNQGFRGQENYAYNRGGEAYNRGFNEQRGLGNQLREPSRDFGGNRLQTMPARPQSFARPGGAYANGYGNTQRVYAEPHSFGGSSNGRGFSQSYHEPKFSGGSHSFGGGGHSQSFHAPKAPKSSGGGGGHHSGGGSSHHHGR